MLKTSSRKEIFQFIYKKDLWLSKESKSGYGSSIRFTENLRKHIPIILTDYSIMSIYDAPCGDFNWMRLIVADSQVEYLGADIVPELIDSNRAKFQTEMDIKFVVSDIIVDPFPTADLWICRDCLTHLSYQDIVSALDNFCKSNTKFMLTTNFINDHQEFKNKDIYTGGYRSIDLFSDPFNFPTSVKYRFRDHIEPDPPMEMVLVSRSDILIALPKMRERIAFVSTPSTHRRSPFPAITMDRR